MRCRNVVPVRLMPTMKTGRTISSRSISGCCCRSTGERRVVAKLAGQPVDEVRASLLQQPGLRCIQRLDKPPEPRAHPRGKRAFEGNAHALGVALGLSDQAVEVQTGSRHRIRPPVVLAPHPVIGTRMPDEQCRPPDRERTVLANGAIVDRRGAAGPVVPEPVRREEIDQGPQPVQRRALSKCLACAPEGLVWNLAQVESEIGRFEIIMRRLRIAAVVDREPPLRIHRNRGAYFTEGIDGLGIALYRKADRGHFELYRREIETKRDAAPLCESRAGHSCLRQAKNRHRHTGGIREQQNLLGNDLAPRVSDETERQQPFHGCEVGLHVMLDATTTELVREIAEILGEYGHRGCVEHVLDTCSQAQREHIAKAGRIHLAHGGVGRNKGQVGGEVVVRVDPPAQIVEVRFAQAESSLANVSGHDPNTRLVCLVPD